MAGGILSPARALQLLPGSRSGACAFSRKAFAPGTVERQRPERDTRRLEGGPPRRWRVAMRGTDTALVPALQNRMHGNPPAFLGDPNLVRVFWTAPTRLRVLAATLQEFPSTRTTLSWPTRRSTASTALRGVFPWTVDRSGTPCGEALSRRCRLTQEGPDRLVS